MSPLTRKARGNQSKMKTFLLSLVLVFTCIVASHSAHVPYLTWENELEDVKPNAPLEHQEQAPLPAGLNCSFCPESTSEQSCTASQRIIVCPQASGSTPSFSCFTQAAFDTNTSQIVFMRNCFPEVFCADACDLLNISRGGVIQSCVTECCNTSECNAGSLPTTEVPTEVATTTVIATTTTVIATTTPLVCGGVLTGLSGNFTSPNYPNNYPNNATCEWIIPPQLISRIRLVFIFFDLQCRDFVTIYKDGKLVRSLTGRGRSVSSRRKRSLEDKRSHFRWCYYGDEDEQLDDDDNYEDDDVTDRYDDGAADSYDDENDDDADTLDDDDDDYEDNDERENGEYLGEANAWGRRWRWRRRRPVEYIGTNQTVKIVFSSDGSGTGKGFSARFMPIRRRPWWRRPWRG